VSYFQCLVSLAVVVKFVGRPALRTDRSRARAFSHMMWSYAILNDSNNHPSLADRSQPCQVGSSLVIVPFLWWPCDKAHSLLLEPFSKSHVSCISLRAEECSYGANSSK
jgi:hypothetical protein